MMKTLYLVRHAKSSWKNADLKDIERPLNKRGKRDAPFMGQLMQERDVSPDLLVSSPAIRAFTTAKYFAKALGYLLKKIEINPKIYEASVKDLFKVIRGLDDTNESAMLFGHNMTYTTFANFYATIDNVPTCGVLCINYEVDKWSEIGKANGQLQFFEYPKKHSQK